MIRECIKQVVISAINKKIFTSPTYKLRLSFTVISDVCRSFIPNETTFTKYCLTQWVSKLHGRFEIHWVWQYQINFTGMAGIVKDIVYNIEPVLTGRGARASTPDDINLIKAEYSGFSIRRLKQISLHTNWSDNYSSSHSIISSPCEGV